MIDETTGLPELPEGHFWRINLKSVEIWKNLPDTDWKVFDWPYDGWADLSFRTDRRSKRERRTQTVDTEVTKTRKRWFREEQYVEIETRGIEETREVERSHRVLSVNTPKTGETRIIAGAYRSGYTEPSRHGYYGYFEPGRYVPGERGPDRVVEEYESVTRSNIEELCFKAIAELDSLNLVGTYPPKKLEMP